MTKKKGKNEFGKIFLFPSGYLQKIHSNTRMHRFVFRAFRFLFFGLLAFDLFLDGMNPRDPSTFLVSKVPLLFEGGLDWVPSPKLLARVQMVGFLAALVASLGSDRRYKHAAIVTAVMYNFAYFANAADRYQHHALLAELLILLPWVNEHDWVHQLIVVTVGIVYFWTAVAKLTDGGLFLSGAFLRTTAPRREVYDLVHTVASLVSFDDDALWSVAALGVVAVELILAGLFLGRRAPYLAIALGVPLHLGFEFVAKLSIGRFSWYCITLYLLILPDFHAKKE